MAIADAPQFLHEDPRSHNIPAFALYRLDEDRRHFLGSERGLEQLFFNEARAAQRKTVRILRACGPAINIGITHMRHPWYERGKTPPLLGLGRGQRERSHGSSMKRAQECDYVLPLGVIARQLQRALDP